MWDAEINEIHVATRMRICAEQAAPKYKNTKWNDNRPGKKYCDEKMAKDKSARKIERQITTKMRLWADQTPNCKQIELNEKKKMQRN